MADITRQEAHGEAKETLAEKEGVLRELERQLSELRVQTEEQRARAGAAEGALTVASSRLSATEKDPCLCLDTAQSVAAAGPYCLERAT